jgi:hypothetical protein
MGRKIDEVVRTVRQARHIFHGTMGEGRPYYDAINISSLTGLSWISDR